MNADNDCNRNVDFDVITRNAASMFIHMIAMNIWHSFMKKDVKDTRFSIPFTMFNGEYLGSIECKNYQQKYSIEGVYIFLLGVESIITGKPLFSGHYDMSGQLRSSKRMMNGILRQLKNKVELSTVYNSNTGKNVPVITIKPGLYILETHQQSTNNLTIDVEVEEEISWYVENNELINDAEKSFNSESKLQ